MSLARATVVAWVAGQYGPTHAERRIGDGGFVFWVNTQDDAVIEGRALATAGGVAVAVLKRTGEYWYVGSHPDHVALYAAKSERKLRSGLGKPDGRFELPKPDALTRADVVAWVAGQYGPTHAERRVRDGGFVFWLDTQDDAVIEGRAPATYGGGPVAVLKSTGEYWHLGSNPHHMALLDANNEHELRSGLGKRAGRVKLPRGPHRGIFRKRR